MPLSDGRAIAGALLGFAAVALLAGIDVAADLREGTTVGHALVEAAVVGVGLSGAIAMGLRLRLLLRNARAAAQQAAELRARLEQTQREAQRWRTESQSLLRGLGEALDRQFSRWALSAAEREVALLLLKGLAHKEIGQARGVSEATARQQARSVYKKAGVSGRNDLAAFFLEDLMLPTTATSGDD